MLLSQLPAFTITWLGSDVVCQPCITKATHSSYVLLSVCNLAKGTRKLESIGLVFFVPLRVSGRPPEDFPMHISNVAHVITDGPPRLALLTAARSLTSRPVLRNHLGIVKGYRIVPLPTTISDLDTKALVSFTGSKNILRFHQEVCQVSSEETMKKPVSAAAARLYLHPSVSSILQSTLSNVPMFLNTSQDSKVGCMKKTVDAWYPLHLLVTNLLWLFSP